jgi:exodeoxyribonuclease VII small subunit
VLPKQRVKESLSLAKDKSSTPPAQPSFEESLAALEDIVHALEEGQIGLADALARYEQGVKLLRQCYELLAGAERKIELLGKVDAQGVGTTEPFDDAPSTSGNAPSRSERRSRTPRSAGDNFAQPAPDEIDEGPTLF